MPSCLVHTGDESVTLSAATVKRLLDRGDGDAALLYLALLRRRAICWSLAQWEAWEPATTFLHGMKCSAA